MKVDNNDAYFYRNMVDLDKGLVAREMFSEESIHKAELRNIFARCWLYLAHESEIPNRGDYVSVMMGTESVIVARSFDGKIRAFLNSCRHRGNRVCRFDRGNTKTFVCSYHGWAFGTSGNLVGVPGNDSLYFNKIDKSKWGLVPVAQVQSYRGLIFGTFDEEAPSLDDYLGDMRWGLDLLLDQGDLIAVPGTIRWSMECNWKFAADNAIGDMYHGGWTHRSAILAGHTSGNGASLNLAHDLTALDPTDGFTMVTAYGHGFNVDFVEGVAGSKVDPNSPLTAWRRDPATRQRLGDFRGRIHRSNQNVFPNLFVNTGSRDLMVRQPISPTRTEVWKTVLIDRNADPETQRMQIRASNRHFGPAGMFEQEDSENWDQSTLGAQGTIAQRWPLNYAMAVGTGEVVEDENSPPRIESGINEHAQLWMYRAWAEFMDAPDWASLKASHSKPEGVL